MGKKEKKHLNTPKKKKVVLVVLAAGFIFKLRVRGCSPGIHGCSSPSALGRTGCFKRSTRCDVGPAPIFTLFISIFAICVTALRTCILCCIYFALFLIFDAYPTIFMCLNGIIQYALSTVLSVDNNNQFELAWGWVILH